MKEIKIALAVMYPFYVIVKIIWFWFFGSGRLLKSYERIDKKRNRVPAQTVRPTDHFQHENR